VKKGTTENILMIGDYGRFLKDICFPEKIYCHEIFPENMCKTRANGRGSLKIFAVLLNFKLFY
jgi:hypothetical protein